MWDWEVGGSTTAFRPLATLLEEHMYIDDGLVRKSLHSSNQPVQNKNTQKLYTQR